jgi:hypothetical protein
MSERILVGTRKGLFELKRFARGWDVAGVHFLGDPVTAVLPPKGGPLHAALDLGHFGVKLWTSENDGKEWQERAAPAFPPQPPEAAGDPHAWTVKAVWVMERGTALWAGTIAGGLFRSDDEGRSWTLTRSLWDREERKQWVGGGAELPGLHSLLVDPGDKRRLIAGVSTGGVWLSDDDGGDWRLGGRGMYAEYMPPERREDPLAQDVHRLAACAAAPDTLWCQHHNGVFRSTDGGETWREITAIAPSKFGFAVAAHPRDPNTAWFVPAIKDECRVPVEGRIVVARTRDGGESFEVLRQGLPQRHAYDLVYRHAFEVDESGERLAMGSTTGGVWLSEDAGESWQELPARLPPVACVRFA